MNNLKIMMDMMEDMIFHFNLELILMENHDGNWMKLVNHIFSME